MRVAEWPVRLLDGRPIVDGAINGKKVNVLVHTSAYASLLTKAAAQRLGLNTRHSSESMTGNRGPAFLDNTRLDELRVGTETVKGILVRVGIDDPLPGIDFILGDDFLKRFDVEFDYAAGAIRLYEISRCVGGSLAYWGGDVRQVGLRKGAELGIPVKLNGSTAIARLDTSATVSLVGRAFADTAGPKAQRLWPAGCGMGSKLSWARFDTFEVAGHVTSAPRFNVTEPGGQRDDEVTLGNDYLQAHRVMLARGQATMYFSYVGGQAFLSTPWRPCDERVRGKKPEEARPILDAAIAANPRDVVALMNRAWYRGHAEAAGAAADLTAAIAIEPDNPVPYWMRKGVRESMKDYRGALADLDAAIERGVVTPGMYRNRAKLLVILGDAAGTSESCEGALRLAPHRSSSYSACGRYLYHAGRLEEAERHLLRKADVRRGADARGTGIDAAWLALVRIRRGADPGAAIEQGLEPLKDGEWPAPVLHYLQGRLDRDALVAKASSSEEKVRKGHVCEANYYVAARVLIDGKEGEARPLLEKAVADCPRNYREYESAVIELKAALQDADGPASTDPAK